MLLKYLTRIQEEEDILDNKPKKEAKKLLWVLQKEDLSNVSANFIKIIEPIKKTTIKDLIKAKKWNTVIIKNTI